MSKISPLSHLKNIFLVVFFTLAANSLLLEIPQIIVREMKLFTFWSDYGY